jgi:hypothetical protein
MFDFENLEVYKKAKAFNSVVGKMILTNPSLDGTTKNQLRRASLSCEWATGERLAGPV